MIARASLLSDFGAQGAAKESRTVRSPVLSLLKFRMIAKKPSPGEIAISTNPASNGYRLPGEQVYHTQLTWTCYPDL